MTPTEDFLISTLADWPDVGWALESARLSGERGPAKLRDIALSIIDEVLVRGLMVAGDIVGTRHVPWPCTGAEASARIRREWLIEWGAGVPAPGAIAWFEFTAAGDAVAHALVREFGAEGHAADLLGFDR